MVVIHAYATYHIKNFFNFSFTGDDDEAGTVPDEFADTQEEEFESEEQWRKQRHEREVFLRQMVSKTLLIIIDFRYIRKHLQNIINKVKYVKRYSTENTKN